ncbi:MAG: hypothetical protein KKH77_01085 [Candidatus Omnitrophica bacterium]|nr:hypothetical protein [Candidatus Omnitrophota bacterium]MBU0880844.1 hypothetical protein [Candidatus Omnitrophota bacterium]MBU1808080.1 hypothetical protein [Candidatus Omnitrophota bacterium]
MNVLLINPMMLGDMEHLFPLFRMAYTAHEIKDHSHCVELLDIEADDIEKSCAVLPRRKAS